MTKDSLSNAGLTTASEHSQIDAAMERYLAASEAFDASLEIAPTNPRIITNKGLTLSMIGRLESNSAKVDKALVTLVDAIGLSTSPGIAPDDVYILANKALALEFLGAAQVQLLQYEAALGSFTNAVRACNRSLACRRATSLA